MGESKIYFTSNLKNFDNRHLSVLFQKGKVNEHLPTSNYRWLQNNLYIHWGGIVYWMC